MNIEKESIEKSIREELNNLGAFHPAFKNITNVLGDMIYDYARLAEKPLKSAVLKEVADTLLEDITLYSEQLNFSDEEIKIIIDEYGSIFKGNEVRK